MKRWCRIVKRQKRVCISDFIRRVVAKSFTNGKVIDLEKYAVAAPVRRSIAILFLGAAGLNPTAYAQSIDTSVIRAAGALCGAGLSADAKGAVDAKVARIFGTFESDGKGSLDIGKASDLLSAFRSSDRNEAFRTYADCVMQIVSSTTGVALAINAESDSPKPRSDVSVDGMFLAPPLEMIEHDQRFTMSVGDIRAVFSDDLVLSLPSYSSTVNGVTYKLSSFETGETDTGIFLENDMLALTASCTILPYEIKAPTPQNRQAQVAFLLQCAEQ